MRRGATKPPRACAYCGSAARKLHKEHVIAACLYPESKANSRVQRITVPACAPCNGSYADDEAHFRNVLLVAGEANASVTELWNTTAHRAFRERDGRRRLLDLMRGMVPVTVDGQQRWMIYPGRDERVVRVVRKIVRGLSHFHHVESPVADDRVWADVLKYPMPDEFLGLMRLHDREADVVRYGYFTFDEGPLSSGWVLTFYERRVFVAAVAAGT